MSLHSLASRIARVGIAVLIAASTGLANTPSTWAAGGSGFFPGHPPGPVYKTLDAVAGGIEIVLERTVLAGRPRHGCDTIGCDSRGCQAPGCDRMMQYPLDDMSRMVPVPQRQSAPAARSQRPPSRAADGDSPSSDEPRSGAPGLSTEEDWFDSFSPSENERSERGYPRRLDPTSPTADPFRDDSQAYPSPRTVPGTSGEVRSRTRIERPVHTALTPPSGYHR